MTDYLDEDDTVDNAFIYCRDKLDQTAISLDRRTIDSESFCLISAHSSSNSYVRVLWPIDRIRKELLTLAPQTNVRVALHLPDWSKLNQLPTWIGLVTQEHYGAAFRLYKKIFDWTTDPTFSFDEMMHFDIRVQSNDRALFFCVHFEKLTDNVMLRDPLIRCAPQPRVGVISAEIRDRLLVVSGWALHPKFPGVPVRLKMNVGDQYADDCIARTPFAENLDVPRGSYGYSMNCLLSRFDENQIAKITVEDSESYVSLNISEILESADLIPESAAVAPPLVSVSDEIIGKVERVNGTEVVGWSLCKQKTNSAVDLVLYVSGLVVAHTRTAIYRRDVQDVHGGNGYSGFRFELPPNVSINQAVSYAVQPVVGSNSIKQFSPVSLPGLFNGSKLTSRYGFSALAGGTPLRPVSAVVLNRNCAALLDDLLRSAAVYEPLDMIEWIIVDHASSDASESVCRDASDRGQIVRFMKRNGNFSFSDSNNYGASFATHEIILFVNNDLVFCAPFLGKFIRALNDEKIGVVGARLTDYLEHAEWNEPAPIQHTGVYIKPYTETKRIRPYESRLSPEIDLGEAELLEVPAVTGAMLGMRKDIFEAAGTWDENYIYGLEDMDLCLKVRHELGKAIVSLQDLDIKHHRAFSRSKELDVVVRQRNNSDRLNRRWGLHLRRSLRGDMLKRPGFWMGKRPTIAFIVVDYGDLSTSGEYYTASELGSALQKLVACHVVFLREEQWYDLSGVDMVIVMVNKFDIHKAKGVSPFLISINWTRQWFDRWSRDESIYAYDHVLASSTTACSYLAQRTGIEVKLLQIAANTDHMDKGEYAEEYACDYCLTANKVGTNREIEQMLVPADIEGVGAVFGHNWEKTNFASVSRGPVPYSRIPDVYKSTKVVLDDANIATKNWGSCNSRVFDSLAAGCLLLTNGEVGAAETFDGLLPTFRDRDSLTAALNYWLSNDEKRVERVQHLQNLVRTQHTYAVRARELLSLLTESNPRIRVAIKCAAKTAEKRIWGDYHFANSLAKSLRRLGLIVRVDCIEAWNSGLSETDDAVIVLSGRAKYTPVPNQLNILWIISHPGSIALNDVNQYDQVYVASNVHLEILRQLTETPVDTMLQCTDTSLFNMTRYNELGRPGKPIFVGNSRGVFRPVVQWAAELEEDFDLYGFGWEQFISDHRLRGKNIPNEVLSSFYSSAKFVMCDHWEDMKRFGYVSNRAFDVLACGGHIVLDDVCGVSDILPGGYTVFKDKDDLDRVFVGVVSELQDKVFERAEMVAKYHSFDTRAAVFADYLKGKLASVGISPLSSDVAREMPEPSRLRAAAS